MQVWMGRQTDTGTVTMLVLRCPIDVKKTMLQKPYDFFALYARYPMLLHLYLLRSLGENHWKTLRNRMMPLHEEVSPKHVHLLCPT